MATGDPTGLKDHLEAARHANDGFAITVWRDGWKLWGTLDAKYAKGEPEWIMTIDGDEIISEMEKLSATGHPMKAWTAAAIVGSTLAESPSP